MELTVKERLVLMGMLPKEGNFLTLRLMRKLREALSFNEEEHKQLKFVQNGEQLSWDFTVVVVKDVEVGDVMLDVITKELKNKDKEGKLTEDHITLYEKFVEKLNLNL
uniref:Uncharacterized protein n=1 Tax=viral metagenome TaxID=1070528 RepID=A0A6M3XS10_9ZZZZ